MGAGLAVCMHFILLADVGAPMSGILRQLFDCLQCVTASARGAAGAIVCARVQGA